MKNLMDQDIAHLDLMIGIRIFFLRILNTRLYVWRQKNIRYNSKYNNNTCNTVKCKDISMHVFNQGFNLVVKESWLHTLLGFSADFKFRSVSCIKPKNGIQSIGSPLSSSCSTYVFLDKKKVFCCAIKLHNPQIQTSLRICGPNWKGTYLSIIRCQVVVHKWYAIPNNS